MNTLAAVRPEGREDLAVLTELSAAVAGAGLDLPVVIDTITDVLATHVADVGMIYLLAEDGETLEMASLASVEPLMYEMVKVLLGNRPRRIDDAGPIEQCCRTGAPVYVDGIEAEALRAQLPDAYSTIVDHFPPDGRYYLYYVPLIAGGELVGLLFVSRYLHDDGIPEADRELVCDVAELTAPVVGHARLHTRLAEMTAVFETAFEHAPLAMAIHTVGPGPSRFVRVNRAMQDLVGRDAASLLDIPITDVLPVEDRAEIADLIARAAAGEITEYHAERDVVLPGGLVATVHVDSRVVQSPDSTMLVLSQVRALTEPTATQPAGGVVRP